jgi:hypothetical protein
LEPGGFKRLGQLHLRTCALSPPPRSKSICEMSVLRTARLASGA